jgi:hypothetical protein
MFLRLFLSWLKSEEEPRKISLQQISVVMITDACCEKDSRDLICGLGGVLVDEAHGVKLFFFCVLTGKQRFILGELRKKQIIFGVLWCSYRVRTRL